MADAATGTNAVLTSSKPIVAKGRRRLVIHKMTDGGVAVEVVMEKRAGRPLSHLATLELGPRAVRDLLSALRQTLD